MKKYEMRTTRTGGVIVRQLHLQGVGGCSTLYGDEWVFATAKLGGQFIDVELAKDVAKDDASEKQKTQESETI